MAKKQFSGKQLVKGLLFGTIVGGSAALLLAPRSGKETRAKITQEIDDTLQLITDFKTNLESVQVKSAHLEETANDLIPEFFEETQKSVRAFEFKTKPRIEEIKKQVKKITNQLDDLTKDFEK